eukprot:TRINITY_DN2073_c1_g1_i3.p1 TRINITY_DN2073_c1_g1~~TRINITY_DN2073_c1_g1_i3.p1  ORF type:complete len:448 (+),score=147.61 TRINITY_DN2073_c1_g1_i3:152-1495(+)
MTSATSSSNVPSTLAAAGAGVAVVNTSSISSSLSPANAPAQNDHHLSASMKSSVPTISTSTTTTSTSTSSTISTTTTATTNTTPSPTSSSSSSSSSAVVPDMSRSVGSVADAAAPARRVSWGSALFSAGTSLLSSITPAFVASSTTTPSSSPASSTTSLAPSSSSSSSSPIPLSPSSGSIPTKILTPFDTGLEWFLFCVSEICAHAMRLDRRLLFTYFFKDGGMIGHTNSMVSIHVTGNNEIAWTKALRYMLTNIRAILKRLPDLVRLTKEHAHRSRKMSAPVPFVPLHPSSSSSKSSSLSTTPPSSLSHITNMLSTTPLSTSPPVVIGSAGAAGGGGAGLLGISPLAQAAADIVPSPYDDLPAAQIHVPRHGGLGLAGRNRSTSVAGSYPSKGSATVAGLHDPSLPHAGAYLALPTGQQPPTSLVDLLRDDHHHDDDNNNKGKEIG